MKRWIWLSLALLVLLPACAASGYQTRETEMPSVVSDVPPSFYGGDPALRQWYTFPYWDPNAEQ